MKQHHDCELPLFVNSPPAVTVPIDTRRAAREKIRSKAKRQKELILQWIRRCKVKGSTDSETSRQLGLLLDSARGRRVELRDSGLVKDGGERRPTPSGSFAIVWIAAEEKAAVDVGSTDGGDVEDRTADRVEAGRPRLIGIGKAGLMLQRKRQGRCAWCGCDEFWLSTGGLRICRNCHPPAFKDLVVKQKRTRRKIDE